MNINDHMKQAIHKILDRLERIAELPGSNVHDSQQVEALSDAAVTLIAYVGLDA